MDAAPHANKELDPNASPVNVDPSQFNCSMRKGKDEKDTNCWTTLDGAGFMIRGKSYLEDNCKVRFYSR